MDGQVAPDAASVFMSPQDPAFTLLDTAVRHYNANIALDFLGRRYSYAELGRLTERAAAGLQKLGVAKGVKVGLCLPNCPYFIIMYYAILKAGGTVVNFNPLYTDDEIAAQARETETSLHRVARRRRHPRKIARLATRGRVQPRDRLLHGRRHAADERAALPAAQTPGAGKRAGRRTLHDVRGPHRRQRPAGAGPDRSGA